MSIVGKVKNGLQLLKCELKGSFKSRKLTSEAVDVPVDFVVAWVDDKDEKWLEERAKYFNSSIERNDIERYRDWDLFMYWFRAVEKYAPWVRKIHFVTFGHVPSWLNTEHEKINIVRHEDFIPNEFLPTFQASPIELNLHRIDGLAEHFVYFNDDMYLNRPTKKEDFFSGAYPKCCNRPRPVKNYGNMGVHEYKCFNNVGIVNGHLSIRESIIKNPELWFNKWYKKEKQYYVRAYRENYLYGMFFPHLGSPMRKSTLKEAWGACEKEFNMVCRHRFRTPFDVQQQVFTIWDIVKGEFFPVDLEYFGRLFCIADDVNEIGKCLDTEKDLMICLNDSGEIKESDFEIIKERIDALFQKKFPEKSEFEL